MLVGRYVTTKENTSGSRVQRKQRKTGQREIKPGGKPSVKVASIKGMIKKCTIKTPTRGTRESLISRWSRAPLTEAEKRTLGDAVQGETGVAGDYE